MHPQYTQASSRSPSQTSPPSGTMNSVGVSVGDAVTSGTGASVGLAVSPSGMISKGHTFIEMDIY